MLRTRPHRHRFLGRATLLAWAPLLVSLTLPPAARADPVGECQVTSADQVAVTECLRADLAAADQVMAGALERLQQRADELDRVTGRPEARAAVDASQAQWQAFREADCRVRGALAAGASGSGQFELACAITLSRLRTDELRALAAGG